MQNEEAGRLELLDNEAALGFRCAVRDEVTDVKILILIDDVSRRLPGLPGTAACRPNGRCTSRRGASPFGQAKARRLPVEHQL